MYLYIVGYAGHRSEKYGGVLIRHSREFFTGRNSMYLPQHRILQRKGNFPLVQLFRLMGQRV